MHKADVVQTDTLQLSDIETKQLELFSICLELLEVLGIWTKELKSLLLVFDHWEHNKISSVFPLCFSEVSVAFKIRRSRNSGTSVF